MGILDTCLKNDSPEAAGPGVLSHEVTGPPICDEDHLFMEDSSENDLWTSKTWFQLLSDDNLVFFMKFCCFDSKFHDLAQLFQKVGFQGLIL